MKHSIAWRLLEVAKNGDYHDRVKAVGQLARIDHLKGSFDGSTFPVKSVSPFPTFS